MIGQGIYKRNLPSLNNKKENQPQTNLKLSLNVFIVLCVN